MREPYRVVKRMLVTIGAPSMRRIEAFAILGD